MSAPTGTSKPSRRKSCEHPSCPKQPSFSFNGSDARFCAKHSLSGMVNVRRRRCEEERCVREPYFGEKGGKARFCATHKPDTSMVDVRRRRCEIESCSKLANYGYEGGRACYCAMHKLPTMVDVKHRRCAEAGCLDYASFAFPGTNEKFCAAHRRDGMGPSGRGRAAAAAATRPVSMDDEEMGDGGGDDVASDPGTYMLRHEGHEGQLLLAVKPPFLSPRSAGAPSTALLSLSSLSPTPTSSSSSLTPIGWGLPAPPPPQQHWQQHRKRRAAAAAPAATTESTRATATANAAALRNAFRVLSTTPRDGDGGGASAKGGGASPAARVPTTDTKTPDAQTPKGMRGAPATFPSKLFKILQDAQLKEGSPVGWCLEGKAFTVYNQKDFEMHVLAANYLHGKFSSFQRQLNMYGFRKVADCLDLIYSHPCFRRDKPELLAQVVSGVDDPLGFANANARLDTEGNPVAKPGGAKGPLVGKRDGGGVGGVGIGGVGGGMAHNQGYIHAPMTGDTGGERGALGHLSYGNRGLVTGAANAMSDKAQDMAIWGLSDPCQVTSSATGAALVDDEARVRMTGGSRRLPDDRGRQQQKPHRGMGPDSPRREPLEIADDVSPMECTDNTTRDALRGWSLRDRSMPPAPGDESIVAASQEIGVNNHIPVFLERTFRMIEQVPDDIVSWSTAGDSFVVKQVVVFEGILPSFFNRMKFLSFTQHLNFFGFKKVIGRASTHGTYGDEAVAAATAAESWDEFRHPQFRRGRRDLLVGIKRQKCGGCLERKRGGHLESGKGAATSAPPELQEILPLMLTFLDSRSWCGCLRVSHAAHDAVQALFLSLMPDGPRPGEGWTVPLDVLTLKMDEAGVAHLAAHECGITISGEAENLAHLKAVIIPPPQSGFVSADGEQYIATSPILRCRWVGNDYSQGPWTVSFPLEEEEGLSNPTEISQVLRRGDDLQDEWEVQTAGLKASTRHPSMQVEVTHFSDVMTADKLREIEKTSTSSFYKRKRVWGTKFFSRYVHVYNTSSEAMTVLQALPAVMESGRGVQLSLPLVGGGGGGNRDITVHDDNTIEVRQVAAWANAVDGNEPPSLPAKFETLLGMKEMRVVPYTVTGSREENNLKVFPRDFFHCSAGYNYYLLQRMIDGMPRPRYVEVEVGNSIEEEAVMDVVMKRKKGWT